MNDNVKNYSRLIAWSISFVLLFAFILLEWVTLDTRHYDPDEFQHIHIIWKITNGKVMYRDFFEHHGPLFHLAGAAVWRFAALPNEMSSILFFRKINFIGTLLLLLLTFLLGKKLCSASAGLYASVLLITYRIFFDKSIEIRPDVFQSVFWLAGVYFFLTKVISKGKNGFITGLLMGAALAMNIKAGIHIVMALSAYAYVYKGQINRKSLTHAAAGIFTVFIAVAFYFLLKNSLGDFLYYYAAYNFYLYFIKASIDERVFVILLPLVFSTYSFWILSVIGLSQFYRKNEKRLTFFVYLSILTSMTALMRIWSQWYLMFLPLLAVAAGHAFSRLLIDVKKNAALLAALLFVFIIQTCSSYSSFLDGTYPTNKRQTALTEYVMKITQPDEKIFFTWNALGGYMFRPQLSYYWYRTNIFKSSKIARRYGYGDEILNGGASVIVSRKNEMDVLSDETRRYIHKHYIEHGSFPGLWIYSDKWRKLKGTAARRRL